MSDTLVRVGETRMASSSRDRISVDLGGFKATLLERARAAGNTPSGLVREALVAQLQGAAAETSAAHPLAGDRSARKRLSLRVTDDQALSIVAAARAAGMPVGAFLADLAAGVPAAAAGGSPRELIAALTASNAELASLSRNLNHLGLLVRQGAWLAVDEYRPVLDGLSHDVRAHLGLATRALADLQPARGRAVPRRQPA